MITGLQPAELPHSEISGSKVVCTYPKLIAAYHVLLRLLEPRHPPFALSFFFFAFATAQHDERKPFIWVFAVHPLSAKIKILPGTMQHPTESGNVKLFSQFIFLHCELLFFLLVNLITYLRKSSNRFYIQYVKDRFHLPFCQLPFGHLFIHLVI